MTTHMMIWHAHCVAPPRFVHVYQTCAVAAFNLSMQALFESWEGRLDAVGGYNCTFLMNTVVLQCLLHCSLSAIMTCMDVLGCRQDAEFFFSWQIVMSWC
jgi:hypothetical protein